MKGGDEIMKTSERIHKRGKELLRIGLTADTSAQSRYQRLNPHQKGMVLGWLGKLKVWSVTEGLDRVEARIQKDNIQGKR